MQEMKELLLSLAMVSLFWIDSSSASLTCECGWTNRRGRIAGGHRTHRNEYPWMVNLKSGCGGSIITKYHILTAAQCTEEETAKTLTVTVGKHYKIGFLFLNNNAKKHSVSKIIQHEDYTVRFPSVTNDISILLLQDPITFDQYVGPVCLPSVRYDLVGKYVKATGWGSTKSCGFHNSLRQVDLEVISNSKCNEFWKKLNEKQLCTKTSGKDACRGDSGGPLVYLDPDTNMFTQVALVSFGDPNCRSTIPGVNTDVFSHMEWIMNTVTKSYPSAQICTNNEEDKEKRKH